MTARLCLLTGLLVVSGAAIAAEGRELPEKGPLLDIEVRTLNGTEKINLQQRYQGKVVLIVNTASQCALTPQYEGLERLYSKYGKRGLVVLGFPSNDFGNQEPGSEKKIQEFCYVNYGVQFPMFAKTRVSKETAGPLYRRLAAASGEFPIWNFHKYLIDRDGRLVASYSSFTAPDNSRLVQHIESLL